MAHGWEDPWKRRQEITRLENTRTAKDRPNTKFIVRIVEYTKVCPKCQGTGEIVDDGSWTDSGYGCDRTYYDAPKKRSCWDCNTTGWISVTKELPATMVNPYNFKAENPYLTEVERKIAGLNAELQKLETEKKRLESEAKQESK